MQADRIAGGPEGAAVGRTSDRMDERNAHLTGILPVDKPAGWTSHDVVARVRRLAGQKQVGHAGTLDPLATGLLLVVLGRATRLSPYLMDTSKEYRAEVVLGATTVTDDAEGPLVTQADVSHLTRDHVERELRNLVGEIAQVPPAYAAIKREGKKLYQLARAGETVEAAPRVVTLHDVELEDWQPPRLRLRVRCGPGTYIRAVARDLGAALGVGGYLHALRRVASGTFRIEEAIGLEALNHDSLRAVLLPADRALVSWPALALDAREAALICHGRSLEIGVQTAGRVRLYGPAGDLVALAHCAEGTIRPFRVFEGGSDAVAHRR